MISDESDFRALTFLYKQLAEDQTEAIKQLLSKAVHCVGFDEHNAVLNRLKAVERENQSLRAQLRLHEMLSKDVEGTSLPLYSISG